MGEAVAWQLLLLAAGIYLLLRGAGHLVDGAAALALRAGMRPILVGLTVVAFGTSAPELATCMSAALRAQGGEPSAADVALGSVIGSNTCNVGLILGLAALIRPLGVVGSLVRREVPFLVGISLFAVVLGWRGALDGVAGDLLLLTFVAFVALVAWSARTDRGAGAGPPTDDAVGAVGDAGPPVLSAGWAGLLVLFGCLLLTVGADLLVDSAIAVAAAAGVSSAVVGLTVVAVGTSLPELAAAVVAARQGRSDLALGSVVGSNTFNIGFVLGLPAAWIGLPANPELVARDMSVMLAFTVALLPLCLVGRGVRRRDGALLVAGYAAYLGLLLVGAL